ncbi:hypothetical protein FPZ43_05505 [Mucilaginibacter pallidiroseus]|uniref:Uncharacterized protein n=1 Tax=Mucilaginibacter pallidiroseus TaxID=2599295 RepID=A0A563UGC5_9SPHI|nr:hypothetical protein [Mucilaginibacter pallidiroseus]TWR30397.1 hypothetical protein FPZ43_05505 [Mucilaginibacter pallidiroseus]
MTNLFTNLLHVFIIVMIAVFVIGGILAITGSFDHWGQRFQIKRRKRRILRQRAMLAKAPNNHDAPHVANKPDKDSVTYNRRYAS